MAIHRIEIKDFCVFQGEFSADFCRGVNIFIGSNGTGKTTLLRAIAIHPILSYPYLNADSHTFHKTSQLKKIDHVEVFPFPDGEYDIDRHIFIPVAEMLSHPEIYPMCQKYNLPYNNSETDVIENAMLPETNEITPNAAKVLDKISGVIGGTVRYENNTFYIGKIPFSLEASGFQKFGLLWKLLRNGLLEKGTVLFWDEPEASINPELMSVLADILLELQRGGVQIFIATHSEILASYFDVKRKDSDSVMFYSLYKDGRQIKADKNEKFNLLKPNHLTAEQVKLYECEIEKGLGNGQ
ncbi:cytochrome c biogenesis protein CcmA [Bacteroidales bacterium Barb6XT]|nr:cytochrome c biogenesis protein CcmA [Bacteroidales bacterium Barb6XT]